MASQRLKGQDTSVLLIVNNQVQANITDVHTSDWVADLRILEEEYLGETAKRYDEIFDGFSGKLGLHLENQSIFDFLASVVDRARRRTTGVQINVKTTFQFPNGDRVRIVLKDANFGSIPFATASRSAYVDTSLDFKGSDYSVIK